MTTLQDLYQKYKNAIIRITVNTYQNDETELPDIDLESKFIKSSGFLINYHNTIYAVTCAHNVLNDHTANYPYSRIYGTVNNVNGETDKFKILPMKIVGVDVYADIAVLRFPHSILHPCKTVAVKFGNKRHQTIGDVCWSSGNPLGSDEASFVQGTLRDNKLAGVNGLFITELVSHDLLIYANNSGSPVLNMEGQVIGICSYTYNNATTKDPLAGFAGGCGSYMMKPIVYNLIDGRHSTVITPRKQIIETCAYPYYQYQKPYFGDMVFILLTTPYILTYYPKNYKHLDVVGFVIDVLGTNNPFKREGLKEGDILTKIKNKQGEWIKLGAYEDYYALGAILWDYNPKYKECVDIQYIPDPNYNCKSYRKKVILDQGFPVDEQLDTISKYVTFISTQTSVTYNIVNIGINEASNIYAYFSMAFTDIVQNPADINDIRGLNSLRLVRLPFDTEIPVYNAINIKFIKIKRGPSVELTRKDNSITNVSFTPRTSSAIQRLTF